MEDSGRPLTAKEKRQEQLKRWENSATDVESSVIQNVQPRVKFNDGAVFLAACSSGDLDEVQTLLNKGADINFANVDGLTALHQACIDEKVDVVTFLIEHGAEIDQEDNEGWTPLHAAASCGFMDIARYLVKNGANVAAVNSEGEVPFDIAEEDDMVEFLQEEINNQGLDIESARNEEREKMTEDANQLLNAIRNGERALVYQHPNSGASALHVAAAKGYIDVIRILLQAGMDVNIRDNDGWAPLHAASHWSQEEAAKMLADKYADFNLRSKLGQTAFDVADEDMLEYLEELKSQQEANRSEMKETDIIGFSSSSTHSKQTITQEIHQVKSEVKNPDEMFVTENSIRGSHQQDISSSSDDDDVVSTSSSETAMPQMSSKPPADGVSKLDNDLEQNRMSSRLVQIGSSDNLRNDDSEHASKLKHSASGGNVSTTKGFSGRRNTRPASLHITSTQPKEGRPPVMSATEFSSNKPMAAAQPIQKSSNMTSPVPSTPTERNSDIKEGAPGTWRLGLRKTGSFDDKMRPVQRPPGGTMSRQADAEKPNKTVDDNATNKDAVRTARVAPILDARLTSKSKNKDDSSERYSFQRPDSFKRYGVEPTSNTTNAPITYKRSISYKKAVGRTLSADPNLTDPPSTRKQLRTITSVDEKPAVDENDDSTTKKTTPPSTATFAVGDTRPERRRSHLQPVRDEEAEAQRKARSRRERQSRRSTQGVTLDVYEEAKRAIDSMKSERSESNSSINKQNNNLDVLSADSSGIPHIDSNTLLHRRFKDGYSTNNTTSQSNTTSRAVTLPSGYIPSNERVLNTVKTAPLNPPNVPTINVLDSGGDSDKLNAEDISNDDDKNGEVPAGQSPSSRKLTAQQKRRQRKERRSTGLPGLPPSDTTTDNLSDDDEVKTDESNDRNKAERLRSTAARYDSSSLPDRHSRHRSGLKGSDTDLSKYNAEERDDKNYRKLYEDQCVENERLRSDLSDAKRQITELEARLNQADDVTARRKAAEAEKRDRRALERKLTDMEKELMSARDKEGLVSKNHELKQENLALIRLVNKLGESDENAEINNNKTWKEELGRSIEAREGDDEETTNENIKKKESSSTRRPNELAKYESGGETSKYSGDHKKTYYGTSKRSSRNTSPPPSAFSSRSANDYSSSQRRGSKSSVEDLPLWSHRGRAAYTSRGLEKRTHSPSNKFSSYSTPSLTPGYHTIPPSTSRGQYGRGLPPSSPSVTSKLSSGRTPTTTYTSRSDKSSLSSVGYRSRFEPSSRIRSSAASLSSASSKRVGNLMDTYRNTIKP